MSADNVIYIKKVGKVKEVWLVWHDFASNDEPKPSGYTLKRFDDENSAEDYAFELEEELGYVEYGIQEFGWQKPINYEVIEAMKQFKE